MIVRWREMPPPARAIALTADAAVSAAMSRDPDAFESATGQLAALNPEQIGLVLGAVVRSLLEDMHPDGLSGDDVQVVLERCARAAANWLPRVDPRVLVVLLTGALGVHDPHEEPRPLDALDVARHAPLLVADLLTISGSPVAGYLDAALAEIARAETVEMP
jgi:hypothetical protein